MKEAHRVYIQSYDGTPESTNISLEDGTVLKNVKSVRIWIERDEMHKADLEIVKPEVDILAEIDEVTLQCPCCQGEFKHECNKDKYL